MPNSEAWITERIAESHKCHTVTHAALSRIEELLYKDLRERALTRTELNQAATRLLTDMAPITVDLEAVT